jgi:hypothetical protein
MLIVELEPVDDAQARALSELAANLQLVLTRMERASDILGFALLQMWVCILRRLAASSTLGDSQPWGALDDSLALRSTWLPARLGRRAAAL